MPTDDLDVIAAELYALPPDEFTAARNARASEADRVLAPAIKALRKPSVAAWAVNRLAREGQLADAVELSAALREAQDDLDSAELSRLGRQRRSLVAALAAQAVTLATDAGVSVSSAAREDVEKTINAAVMDPAAASLVLSARLVRSLEAGALDDDLVQDAVGGSVPGAVASVPRDDLADRRARKAAEKAARDAEREASEANRELVRAETRRDKARERVDHLRERMDDLRRELGRLEEEVDAAEQTLTLREDEHAPLAARAKSAATAAEAARRGAEAATGAHRR